MGSLTRRLKRWLRIKRAEGDLPPRLLMIICNPRSGSTWFADALRCHPCVRYWPRASVYVALDLCGRRYPRDLSAGRDGIVQIEVCPDEWEWIPRFTTPELADQAPDRFGSELFAIEKVHPEFYGFAGDTFLAHMDRLDRAGVNVICVYQVRDPRASLVSFLKYQARNPDWYPYVPRDAAGAHMRRTFESMAEVARRRPGLVVDYGDIVADLPGAMLRVYRALWPEPEDTELVFLRRVAQAAVDATARDNRDQQGRSFLGQEAGPVREDADGEYAGYFTEHENDVSRCYDCYYALKAPVTQEP